MKHTGRNLAQALSSHSSGTHRIGTLPPAPPSIVPILRDELQARLKGLPLDELVRLLRDSEVPAPESAQRPSTEPSTVRDLIRQVLGHSALPSQDVVRKVQTLRPGTPGPTVRSDLSRMRVAGELEAVGPVRGGKLRVAK